MIVDSVSPTPFALLRRAKHFEYRDEDRALQEFSNYEDPVQALTEECRRVLKCISSTNQSTISTSKASTSLPDASWSRFEDIGFGGFGEDSDHEDEGDVSALGKKRKSQPGFGLKSAPQSKNDFGRPTTPSWADFLSSGFVDETNNSGPAPLHLPHDKILPPIDTRRGQSSQSHRRGTDDSSQLEPGELASINTFYYDDAFWWVWISSLAGEETILRKAVFGRCALIETTLRGGKWLVVEEVVKGAAPEPDQGAYIAEKKTRFGFSKRGKLNRTKSMNRKTGPPPTTQPYSRTNQPTPMSKTSIGPDQHARIQAAAAALQQKQKQQERQHANPRRARMEDSASTKTNSVFTLQPIMSEAVPAMKWANSYDKDAIRAAYLGNNSTGKGSTTDLATNNIQEKNGPTGRPGAGLSKLPSGQLQDRSGLSRESAAKDRDLPALPPVDAPKQRSISPLGDWKAMTPSSVPVTISKDVPNSDGIDPRKASIALSATVPAEANRASEDKPLPLPTQASNLSVASTASSPESKRSTRKLAKTPVGGFKGLFGKRKPEPTKTRPSDSSPGDSTAPATAARAAFIAPQIKPNSNASQSTIGRRLSLIGRKKSPGSSSVPSPVADLIRDSEKRNISPPAPTPHNRFGSHESSADSKVNLSRVETNEEHQANREFRRFDQGPLTDQPAFAPVDSSQQHHSEASTPVAPIHENPVQDRQTIQTRALPNQDIDLHRQPGERQYVREEQLDPEVSEPEDVSPAPDRWAQIRKNAAERAARLQNESATRPSHGDKTDDSDGDGETLPEEST